MFKDSATLLSNQEFLLYVVALPSPRAKSLQHTDVNDRLKQIACAGRCILAFQMGEFPATFRCLLEMETVTM